jgi:hypothetical protein
MTFNQSFRDCSPRGSKDATHSCTRYTHQFGDLFLLQALQVDLPDNFNLFQA